MSIAVRITDLRTPSAGFAEAFFSVVLGIEEGGEFTGLVKMRDTELRSTQGGEKYVKFKQVPRIKKIDDATAAYQKKEDGKVHYDNVVEFDGEVVEGKWTMPKAVWNLKDEILAAVLEEMGQEAPRKAPAAKAAAKPAAASKAAPASRAPKARPTVAATTGATEKGSPLGGGSDDDELPF